MKGSGIKSTNAPDLDAESLVNKLKTEILGRRVVFLQKTGSTNRDAFDLAVKGEPEGTVVIADSQSEGRGRLDRRWESPAGKNLYASAILRPGLRPDRIGVITLAAGVAAAEAVSGIAGLTPGLKWPNDVLIRGRKAAGILTQARCREGQTEFVILGIGVNLNAERRDFSAELAKTATSLLLETGRPVSRQDFAAALFERLEFWYKILTASKPDRIIHRWTELSASTGRRVTVETPGGIVTGRALGLDQDGALLVETPEGTRRITAGDVENEDAICN